MKALFGCRFRYATVVLACVLHWGEPSASAQFPDEPPSVFLEDSPEARNRLVTVEALLRERDWDEAVGLIHKLVETYNDKVVPVGESGGHLDLRLYCHARIAALPAEALRQYRQRVDANAAQLLEKAIQTGDNDLLEQVVDLYYCSTSGDKALELLGDRALSRGWYHDALDWWSRLLPMELAKKVRVGREVPLGDVANPISLVLPPPFPQPMGDRARLVAKWTVAHMLVGNNKNADAGIAYLRQHHPRASGKLAGREGFYWEILSQQRAEPDHFARPLETSDWPTWGGNFQRAKNRIAPVRVAGVHANWELSGEEPLEDEGEDQEFGPAAGHQLPYYPVIVGKQVFIASAGKLWMFDLENPSRKMFWELANSEFGTEDNRHQRQSLTVAGDRVYLTRVSVRQRGRRFPIGGPRFRNTYSSQIQCLDLTTRDWVQEGNWPVKESVVGENCAFEGAPVVIGDAIYIAATRYGAMAETQVACLDRDGKLRWRTTVCIAAHELGNLHSLHNLLTLHDNTLYYCTNLGAVAALNARTGRLRWIATYPRAKPVWTGLRLRPADDLNPCLVHRDRVFVVPADSTRIYCYHAPTGSLLWQTPPDQDFNQLLGFHEDKLIVAGNGVAALAVDSGRPAWTWPLGERIPSFGRGLLLSGEIYWPTRTHLHVLSAENGLPAWPAIHLDAPWLGIRGGGNLAPGNGYLLVAQSQRLIALAPFEKLKTKLERELVNQPNPASLHFRLGELGWNHRDYPLADKHFQLAAARAEPFQTYQGRNLTEWARERRFDVLLALAVSDLDQNKTPEKTRFATALAAAPGAEQTARALLFQAERTSLSAPVDAAKTYQRVISDAGLANAPIEVVPQWRRSAGNLAASHLAALRTQKPKEFSDRNAAEVFAPFSPAEKTKWLTLVRNDPAHGIPALARAIEARGGMARQADTARDLVVEWTRTGHHSAARRLAYWATRTPNLPDAVRAILEKTLDFPTKPKTGRLESEIHLAWEQSPAGQCYLPQGEPITDAPLLIVTRPRLDAPVGALEATTWEGWNQHDGKPRWRRSGDAEIRWLAHSAVGLILASERRVLCLDETTGETIWEHFLEDRIWHGAHTNWQVREHYLGESAVFLFVNQRVLTALRLVDGRVAWQREFADLGTDVGMDYQYKLLWLRGAEYFLALSPVDGVEKGRVSSNGTVNHLPLVAAADTMAVVTDRATIAGVRGADCQLAWKFPVVSPSFDPPRLFGVEGGILALIDGYQLALLDPRDGKARWHRAIAEKPRPAGRIHALVSQGVFVIADAKEIAAYSLEQGELSWRRSPRVDPTGLKILGGNVVVQSHDLQGLEMFALADGHAVTCPMPLAPAAGSCRLMVAARGAWALGATDQRWFGLVPRTRK